MNAVLNEVKPGLLATPTTDREGLIDVLLASVYPGAKRNSVAMVLDYCTARQLDPLQKPVHIVPMLVKNGLVDGYGNDKKEWRDVIMPGIGLYRIQAARTGAYLGVSEPTFGPDIEMEYAEEFWEDKKKKSRPVTVTFPLWCKVTVRRQVGAVVAEFTALEYWRENMAEKGNGPNTMWAKRPYGQLAKCAEAQALRKAFPEVGSEATAEEMEGRLVDVNDLQVVEGNPPSDAAPSLTPQRKSAAAAATDAEPTQPAAQPAAQQEPTAPAAATQPAAQQNVIEGDFKEVADKPAAKVDKTAAAPAAAGPVLTEGMQNLVKAKMASAGKGDQAFEEQFGYAIAAAPRAKINEFIAWATAA